MARIDPLRNFRYRLEIDGITQAGFSEVMIAGQIANDLPVRTMIIRRGSRSSLPHRS